MTSSNDRPARGVNSVNPQKRAMCNWDDLNVFARWDVTRRIFGPATKQILAQLLVQYLPADAELLEIGSGLGHLYELMPESRRSHLLQTDASAKLVQENRRMHPNARVSRALAGGLPFKRESFGGVLALAAFDTFDALPMAVTDMARVLKPGGVFLHLHDLGAQDATFIRGMPSGSVAFPLVRGNQAVGLQILSAIAFRAAVDYWPSQVLPLVKMLAADPANIIPALEPDILRKLSDMVQNLPPEIPVNAFASNDRFASKLTEALAVAGLTVEFNGTETRELLVPRDESHLLGGSLTNWWLNIAGAVSSSLIDNLPEFTTLIRSELLVTVATKSLG